MEKLGRNIVYVAGILVTVILAAIYFWFFGGSSGVLVGIAGVIFALLFVTQGIVVILSHRTLPGKIMLYGGGSFVLAAYAAGMGITAVFFALYPSNRLMLMLGIFLFSTLLAAGLLLLVLNLSGKVPKKIQVAKRWEDMTLRVQVLVQRIHSDMAYKLYDAFHGAAGHIPGNESLAKIDVALTELEALHLAYGTAKSEEIEKKISEIVSLIEG